MTESDWFDLSEACRRLKCHENTLYREIEKGKLVPGRLGRRWRFNDEMITKYLMRKDS